MALWTWPCSTSLNPQLLGGISTFVCVLALCSNSACAGETRYSESPESGLATWETETDHVHLRMTQISPDQARAFMTARGLDEKSVEEFARHCVFMTVLRNEYRRPITFGMTDWRYVPEGGVPQVMLTRHDWLARFQNRHLSQQVKLAFEWSQFPVEQTFYPGDWNQGMTTFELPPGSQFDVIYRWRQGRTLHEGTLKNVQCVAEASAH
jgi:hypothetical protein